jgi:hypothetical protein
MAAIAVVSIQRFRVCCDKRQTWNRLQACVGLRCSTLATSSPPSEVYLLQVDLRVVSRVNSAVSAKRRARTIQTALLEDKACRIPRRRLLGLGDTRPVLY